MLNFNSHAHVERDTSVTVTDDSTGNFNSHAHVERDLTFSVILQEWQISTHTLTWSVTRELESELKAVDNFNSHAHVERDGGEI